MTHQVNIPVVLPRMENICGIQIIISQKSKKHFYAVIIFEIIVFVGAILNLVI